MFWILSRLLLVLLPFSVCKAGPWKESLNFHLENRNFTYINTFHRGLSDVAQQHTEGARYHVRDVEYDNVGNCLFTSRGLRSDQLRPPINSENVAFASLQIIFDDFSAQFVHLTDTVGGRTPQHVRAFSSSTYNSHTSGEAITRLHQKRGENFPSKPNSFDTGDFLLYHPNAHSEDKIYYVLSRDYRTHIDQAWRHKPTPTSKIIGVVLHLHTRFDMCGSCSYALDWELNHPEGFGAKILQCCQRLNQTSKALVSFSTLVSSRQGFLVWDKERRTLPEPPPLANPGNYDDDYGVYKRQIGFEEDLSAPKRFAQAVIPPFLPRISENPVYEFAKSGDGGVLFRVRPV